jgi:hypothetical protein
LPPATGQAIRQAVLEAPDDVCGYVIPVQFVEDGSPAGGTRVDHVKLFRNRPNLRWEGRIHEQILPSLHQGGGRIVRLDAIVLHSGYDTSSEGQARKHARDDRLLDLDLQDQPTNPFRLFNRGMTDHYRGNHEAAVQWLRRSLQFSGPSDSQVRKVYALLSVSLRQLGRLDEAMTTLEEGLAAVGEDPELHFQMAYLLSSQEEFPRAKEHYLRCLHADTSGHFSSMDRGILGYKTYHNLAGVCRMLGSYAQALCARSTGLDGSAAGQHPEPDRHQHLLALRRGEHEHGDDCDSLPVRGDARVLHRPERKALRAGEISACPDRALAHRGPHWVRRR